MGDGDVGIYFRPDVGNNILIGSADPVCDVREYVDPDNYNTSLTDSQWEAQVLRFNRRVPSAGVPHEKKGIVDLYDVSDDWLPITIGQISMVSTWPLGPVATSTRTLASWAR